MRAIRRHIVPVYDTHKQMLSRIQPSALAMIRDCIHEVRWSTVPKHEASDNHVVPKEVVEQFLCDVRAWLRVVRRASEKRWPPNEAWFIGFQQHLALIVGPHARSELGRAASRDGYKMLADEFRVLFGIYRPDYPGLCEPEKSEQDCKDEELAALFHSLPEDLRYGQDAATRLLGVVVRLAGARPQCFGDTAAEHLARLRRLLVRLEPPAIL